MGQFIDLTGRRFERLVVTGVTDARGYAGAVIWLVDCDCGTKDRQVLGTSLRAGNTQSCGCLQRERSAVAMSTTTTTHGMTDSAEYGSWRGMKDRCYNPRNHKFHRYGARGIQVCERWLESFENFFADMGLKPSPSYSIERKDNNGNYEPNNCKWATSKEQSRNTSQNRLVTLNGITRCLVEWVEILGLNESTVRSRIYRQRISPEEALTL